MIRLALLPNNIGENSFFGPFLKFASLFGPNKKNLPFLTLNVKFVPYVTLPSIFATSGVKCNVKRPLYP